MSELPPPEVQHEAHIEKPIFDEETFNGYQSDMRLLERAQHETYALLVKQLEAGVGQAVFARFEPTRVRLNETPNQIRPAYEPGDVNHASIEAIVVIEGVYKERGDALFGTGEKTYLVPIANIERINAV